MHFSTNPIFASSGSNLPQNEKFFSFQPQTNNQNSSNQENKENFDNSLRKDYEFLLDSAQNEQQPLNLSERFQNVANSNILTQKSNILEKNELDQMLENKNIILKKLKIAPRSNFLMQNDGNDLILSERNTQKLVKSVSTIKKPNYPQENENSFRNENLEIYENLKENNNMLVFCQNSDSKLAEDYKRQIDLLEKNFEKQKNQQSEINEYRKLINHFEEKINLLIDDNQRLVGLVEVEREELIKFKINSEGTIKNYDEKVIGLERELKFKEDRYNEAILCLDAYKIDLEKLKDFKNLTERERKNLLEESKKTNLKILELERSEEKNKSNNQTLTSKIEILQSELNESKAKRESLEINIKEILKKNQILNREMNERIAELNKTKKDLESSKQEKQAEKEKLNFQIEQIQLRFEEFKIEKDNEIKQLKEELKAFREKYLVEEKNIIRVEEVNKNLENAMRRIEFELNEKRKELEIISTNSRNEIEILRNNSTTLQKENENLKKDKEEILSQFTQTKEQFQAILKTNESLKLSLKQTNNDYQVQLSNYNKNTQNLRMCELNDLTNNFQKQILAKTKFNNEIMIRNKELMKEIENLKFQKEDYKQKLNKMDLNYSKAMQELKKSYEQEKNIKNKDFQFQISEINNVLYEKEKQINFISKEKQEILAILRKTTEEFNKKCVHEVEAKTLKKIIDEKSNENDFLKRGLSLNRIRNLSAERDVECQKSKSHRSGHEYRRSLHVLRENDNLNNDIYRNCMYLY